ncbi:MAG: D-glycero-beta-D-manno-heptose 1,7-bisphosphate 7-phosphatase [Lentisphaeria bacterium]|nr:D-glycero-beta-D-manno-heptose 1,7-bisphosphate 7-phosphatase [Lentisphaeria bacterium]
MSMNKAFFLDRDGVVNEEVDYLSDPDQVVILPGVAPALRRLREAGFLAVVVTNQSGVARGMYGEADVLAVHERIRELLAAEGAGIDRFYYCPHHAKYGSPCSCRKPQPGMLLAACRDLDIDPARSAMVGDRLSDVAAGRAAGCRACYLVKTGYGLEVIRNEDIAGIDVAENLSDAVERFLKRERGEA